MRQGLRPSRSHRQPATTTANDRALLSQQGQHHDDGVKAGEFNPRLKAVRRRPLEAQPSVESCAPLNQGALEVFKSPVVGQRNEERVALGRSHTARYVALAGHVFSQQNRPGSKSALLAVADRDLHFA